MDRTSASLAPKPRLKKKKVNSRAPPKKAQPQTHEEIENAVKNGEKVLFPMRQAVKDAAKERSSAQKIIAKTLRMIEEERRPEEEKLRKFVVRGRKEENAAKKEKLEVPSSSATSEKPVVSQSPIVPAPPTPSPPSTPPPPSPRREIVQGAEVQTRITSVNTRLGMLEGTSSSGSVRLKDADPREDTAVLAEEHVGGRRQLIMPLQKYHTRQFPAEETNDKSRKQATPSTECTNAFYSVNKHLELSWPEVPIDATKPVVVLPNLEESVTEAVAAVNKQLDQLEAVDPHSGLSLTTEIRFGTSRMFLANPRHEEIAQENDKVLARNLMKHLGSMNKPLIVWSDAHLGPFCPLLDKGRIAGVVAGVNEVLAAETLNMENAVKAHQTLLSDDAQGSTTHDLTQAANEEHERGGQQEELNVKFTHTYRADVSYKGLKYIVDIATEEDAGHTQWKVVRDFVPIQATIPGIGLNVDMTVAPIVRQTNSTAWLEHEDIREELLDAVRVTKRLMLVGDKVAPNEAENVSKSHENVEGFVINAIASIDRTEETIKCPQLHTSTTSSGGHHIELERKPISIFTEDITTTVFKHDACPDVTSMAQRVGIVVPQEGVSSNDSEDPVRASVASTFDVASHLIDFLSRHPNDTKRIPPHAIHSAVGTSNLLPQLPNSDLMEKIATNFTDLQESFKLQPPPFDINRKPKLSVLCDKWMDVALECGHARIPKLFDLRKPISTPVEGAQQGILACGFDVRSHELLAAELDTMTGTNATDTVVHVSAINHAGVVIRAHMNTQDASLASCEAHVFNGPAENALQFMFGEENFVELITVPEPLEDSKMRMAMVQEVRYEINDGAGKTAESVNAQQYPAEVKEMIDIYKTTMSEALSAAKTGSRKKSALHDSSGNIASFGPHSGCAPTAALSLCSVVCKTTYAVDSTLDLVIKSNTLIDLAASHTTTKTTMINATFIPRGTSLVTSETYTKVQRLLAQYEKSVKRLSSVFSLQSDDEPNTSVILDKGVEIEAIMDEGSEPRAIKKVLSRKKSSKEIETQEESQRLVNFLQSDFMKSVTNKKVDINVFPQNFRKNAIMAELFDAASVCSGTVVSEFEREGVEWLKNLTDRGIVTLQDLDDVVGTKIHVKILNDCGIPEELIQNMFAPGKDTLPCGSNRLFPSRREVPIGLNHHLVAVTLEAPLVAPFGQKGPGDHVLVGLATKNLQEEVLQSFPASQVGVVDRRYVVVNDSPSLALPMISQDDAFFKSIQNAQVARTYTSSGGCVPMARIGRGGRHLRPLTEQEQALVPMFQVPSVGRPLYVNGRLLGFYAPGTQALLREALKNVMAAPIKRL